MALSFSVPDSILSTTLANYSKNMADNIFKAIPLYSKIWEKKRVEDGGESIK